jgi:hypothetical protein
MRHAAGWSVSAPAGAVDTSPPERISHHVPIPSLAAKVAGEGVISVSERKAAHIMLTYIIAVAGEEHLSWAPVICAAIAEAAAARGTGIARREPAYIEGKMREGKAVIAFARDDVDGREDLAGFCYIETWSEKRYVANSGLIVLPAHRHAGLAMRIKRRVFELSRERFPQARIFGITTSHAVMKINTSLGYVPAPFSELTADEEFWNGCRSCPNFDILTRTNRSMCLCTGMLYDPERPHPIVQSSEQRQWSSADAEESVTAQTAEAQTATEATHAEGAARSSEEVLYV